MKLCLSCAYHIKILNCGYCTLNKTHICSLKSCDLFINEHGCVSEKFLDQNHLNNKQFQRKLKELNDEKGIISNEE